MIQNRNNRKLTFTFNTEFKFNFLDFSVWLKFYSWIPPSAMFLSGSRQHTHQKKTSLFPGILIFNSTTP